MTKTHNDHYWICRDCAVKMGGRIPEHSRVTMHYNDCPYCGEPEKALCATSDYNWPDGTKAIFD